MKDSKQLKGGIFPLLGLLAVTAATEGISAGIDHFMEADAKKKEREAAMREREAQIEADIINRRIAGENAQQANAYVNEVTRQQKQFTNDYRNSVAAAQNEFFREQQRMNQLTTQEELRENQARLRQFGEISKARLGTQQQTAEDIARIRGMRQVAMAQAQKRAAPQVAARRLPAARSTTLLTRRGRGYDTELLGVLQSYYGISLKEAKKLYKAHF